MLSCFFVCFFTSFLSTASFVPFRLRQVPGQLHGRRQRGLHERKSSQRHAHHHPTQEVHSAHQNHLSAGQEAQTGVASSDGGRRRPGEQTGRGRPGGSSVPWVRLHLLIYKCAWCCYCTFLCSKVSFLLLVITLCKHPRLFMKVNEYVKFHFVCSPLNSLFCSAKRSNAKMGKTVHCLTNLFSPFSFKSV